MGGKIIINSQNHLRVIKQAEIIYCKSDNCYTSIHLLEDSYVVCKSLSKLVKELNPQLFKKVNQSYLVNLECIQYVDKKSKELRLINNATIPFTITIKELLEMLGTSMLT